MSRVEASLGGLVFVRLHICADQSYFASSPVPFGLDGRILDCLCSLRTVSHSERTRALFSFEESPVCRAGNGHCIAPIFRLGQFTFDYFASDIANVSREVVVVSSVSFILSHERERYNNAHGEILAGNLDLAQPQPEITFSNTAPLYRDETLVYQKRLLVAMSVAIAFIVQGGSHDWSVLFNVRLAEQCSLGMWRSRFRVLLRTFAKGLLPPLPAFAHAQGKAALAGA